jgi:hypothetical protein
VLIALLIEVMRRKGKASFEEAVDETGQWRGKRSAFGLL